MQGHLSYGLNVVVRTGYLLLCPTFPCWYGIRTGDPVNDPTPNPYQVSSLRQKKNGRAEHRFPLRHFSAQMLVGVFLQCRVKLSALDLKDLTVKSAHHSSIHPPRQTDSQTDRAFLFLQLSPRPAVEQPSPNTPPHCTQQDPDPDADPDNSREAKPRQCGQARQRGQTRLDQLSTQGLKIKYT